MIAAAAFVLAAGWGGTLSILRHASVHARSLDQAYYVRLVWGLGHGLRDLPIVGATDALGLHFEPILWPLAWVCAWLPAGALPTVLLVLQALIAAAAVFPALRLARRHVAPTCGDALAGLVACTAVLIPTVTRNVDYDFHPITLGVTPLLYLADALDDADAPGRWPRIFAWAIISLGFREDVGLQLGALGVAFALRKGPDRPHALGLASLGLAWFFAYTLILQPGRLPATGSFDAHFGGLGPAAQSGGVGGVLRAAVEDPVRLVRYLISADRPWSLVLLLAQVGFLALGAPRLAIGALPIVGINLLSDLPNVRAIQTHYMTGAAPFLVAAAIVGAGALSRRLPSRTMKKIPAVFLASAVATAWWLRGASPGSIEWRPEAYRRDAHAAQVLALVRALPADAPIVAPARIVAHTAERSDVRRVP